MGEKKGRVRLSRKQMYTIRRYLRTSIQLFAYSFVKYLSFPGSNFLRYLALKPFMKELRSTYISDGVTVWFPEGVSMGRNSSLNQGCNIYGLGGIEIGNDVRIACYVTIYSADHEFSDRSLPVSQQGYVLGKVVICDGVWIGAGARINKNVTIGEGAVIGSGAVVTKDVPPYSVVAGVPAKVIAMRDQPAAAQGQEIAAERFAVSTQSQ